MEQRGTIAWITVFPHTLYGSFFASFAKQYASPALTMVLANRYRGKGFVPAGHGVVYAPYAQPIRVTGLGYFKNIDATLGPLKPSAIIVNLYYSLPALQTYWFAKKEGIPFYISAEEDGYRNMWQRIFFPLWDIVIGRRILASAAGILCWSRATCLFMETRVVDKGKIIYFPACIDTAEILPAEGRERSPELRLILPARLVPVKNHELLLKALRIVRDTHRVPVRLTVLGDGPLRDSIERSIQRYELSGVVDMRGAVERDEVLSSYASHDILVLPGRHETIGLVVLEAMACGIPVIISDTLGARDFIEDGVSGLLFTSGNAEDLAAKIAMMAGADLRSIGAQARLRVQQEFDTKKQSQVLYKTLFGDAGGAILKKKKGN